MIKCSEIKDQQHIKVILDNLKPTNKYLDTISEDSFEYENICFKIAMQFAEIEEFLFGLQKLKMDKLFYGDLIAMTFWDYLKNKISFKKLIKEITKYNDNYSKE